VKLASISTSRSAPTKTQELNSPNMKYKDAETGHKTSSRPTPPRCRPQTKTLGVSLPPLFRVMWCVSPELCGFDPVGSCSRREWVLCCGAGKPEVQEVRDGPRFIDAAHGTSMHFELLVGALWRVLTIMIGWGTGTLRFSFAHNSITSLRNTIKGGCDRVIVEFR